MFAKLESSYIGLLSKKSHISDKLDERHEISSTKFKTTVVWTDKKYDHLLDH